MIRLSSNGRMYISCPAALATGGTELLHQLAFKLRTQGLDAVLYYSPSDHPHPAPNEFGSYKIPFEREIVDDKNNIFLVPEVDIYRGLRYRNMRKVIWWLSVDNYYKSLTFPAWHKRWVIRLMVEAGIRYGTAMHLAQSMYARRFLEKKGLKDIEVLSDYLDREFIEEAALRDHRRRDIVLYNPSKGLRFTQEIMAAHQSITYVPLTGLARHQLISLLRDAKVYIDFGEHPGKDRLPREAAISGCCVITGRNGSAGFHEDVPIPDDFKFDAVEGAIPSIVAKMLECLNNFEGQTKRFNAYREVIRAEEKRFDEDLSRVFRKEP